MTFYAPRNINSNDQLLFDAAGNCVGIQPGGASTPAIFGLTPEQSDGFNSGNIIDSDGAVLALSETSPYVTLTATGTAFTGACELAGWYCSVAAGNITVYDALSATGTPIVPATALVAGPLPIFGAGTNGKMALATGCHVVLSGAATVRVLVA